MARCAASPLSSTSTALTSSKILLSTDLKGHETTESIAAIQMEYDECERDGGENAVGVILLARLGHLGADERHQLLARVVVAEGLAQDHGSPSVTVVGRQRHKSLLCRGDNAKFLRRLALFFSLDLHFLLITTAWSSTGLLNDLI